MKETSVTVSTRNYVVRIADIAERIGILSSEMGEVVREAIAADPEFADKACEIDPRFTPAFINKLALIGTKCIPELAFDASPVGKKLKALPLSLQREYLTKPVPLLIFKNNDWETLHVDVRNLQGNQPDQVFADDHVRTDAEQRAWIEDRAVKQSATLVKPDVQYRRVGDEVIFMAGARFKRRELAQLLADLEK